MNIRTFFKIYSFPFLIVISALIIYGAIVILTNRKILTFSRINLNEQTYSQAHVEELGISTDKQEEVVSHSVPNLPQSSTKEDEPVLEKQEETNYAYYAKYNVKIRKAPTTDSAVVARASMGEKLIVLDFQDEWSKIKNQSNIQGYVASRLIEKIEGVGVYVVLPNLLNVRLKADKRSSVIGQFPHNMHVMVLEIESGWAKIQLPNKQYGYVSMEFLAKEKS